MAQNTTRGANTPRKGRSSFNLVSLERRVDLETVSSVAVDEGVGWLFSFECCVEICPSSNGLCSWLSPNAFTEGCTKKNNYVCYKQDLKYAHQRNHVSVHGHLSPQHEYDFLNFYYIHKMDLEASSWHRNNYQQGTAPARPQMNLKQFETAGAAYVNFVHWLLFLPNTVTHATTKPTVCLMMGIPDSPTRLPTLQQR